MAQVRDFLTAGPSGDVRSPARVLPVAPPADEGATETRSLAAVGPAAPPVTPPAPGRRRGPRTGEIVALVGSAVAVVLALVLFTGRTDEGSEPDNSAAGSPSSPAASSTASPSRA